MPAVTVAGAGAAVGALAAAPPLVGAAAADPPALPLAAVGAAGLAGAPLGPLLGLPPHAARSRPLTSAKHVPQRAPEKRQRVIGGHSLLPRAHVPGEEILIAPRL